MAVHRQSAAEKDWRHFIWIAVISVPVFYLTMCAALSYLVLSGNRERIFDVREFKLKGFNYADMTGAYLAANVTTSTVLFIGSSFTFGYRWAARFAFPSVFARETGLPVVNSSVLAGGLEATEIFALCELRRRNLRAKIIVLEIPLVNELSWLAKQPPGAGRPKGQCNTNAPPSFFQLVLLSSSARWLQHTSDFYRKIRPDAVPKIIIEPIEDGYFAPPAGFARVKGLFAERVAEVVDFARQYADEVYAFVTPVYTPGVTVGGQDRQNVEAQLVFAEGVCTALLGPRCIRTAHLKDRLDHYSNLTHLSIHGHIDFGREMARVIATVPRDTPR